MWKLPTFRRGDRVEVRSREEILATLDAQAAIEGMPFMPEMLKFCGRQFTVAAVAHKTCDTVNRTGGRKLERMVHLEDTRCDGSAHGGCEANCNLFWREEWLKPAAGGTPVAPPVQAPSAARCTVGGLQAAIQAAGSTPTSPVYSCQATCVPHASRPLAWWDLRQYWRDVRTGNQRRAHVLRVLVLALAYRLMTLPVGYRLLRALYARLHRRLTGHSAPHVVGTVPEGLATPIETLGLAPGERVRVKSAAQIAESLSTANKNRGLWFDSEEVPYCGGTYTVQRQVTRIIDERSGRMLPIRTPCVILEGVVCRALYSEKRLLCPRAITPYWREIWLERADPATD